MTTSRRVLVLGADGYLGWPLALHLSELGHEVAAADSLARRRWDDECGTYSLVPIRSMEQRVARWAELTGKLVRWHQVDLCDPEPLDALVAAFRPDAVVHLAEQRSGPFSMIDQEHAVRTQVNNIVGNLNLLFSLHRHVPECHLVKLGSMGGYGSPNIDIEEGYLTITHNGRVDRLPYPRSPQSYFHLSQLADNHNIALSCRIWGIRATQLEQGTAYGLGTPETRRDPILATRFDFDAIWGTALNRFLAQAAAGHPLTVYGKGGQTRGYIDIRDTMAGVALALDRPAEQGECRVFNQFAEQFSLNELAALVAQWAGQDGAPVEVRHLPNPRVEAEEHYYRARRTGLADLGLSPHRLGRTLVESIVEEVRRHADRIDPALLGAPSVDWRDGGNQTWTRYRRESVAFANEMQASTTLRHSRGAGQVPAAPGEGGVAAGRFGEPAAGAGPAGGNGSAAAGRRGRLPVTGIIRTLESRGRHGVGLERHVRPAGGLEELGVESSALEPQALGGPIAGELPALQPAPPSRPARVAPMGRPPGGTSRRRALVVAALAVAAAVAVPLTIRALDSAAHSISAVVEPTNQVNLNFQNSGPLAAILVKPGQRVGKGQVVATQAAVSEATAVANDQATLAADQAQLDQLEQLLKVDYNAIAQVDVVRAAIARDQAQLAVDKQRQIDTAAQTSLASPVDGLVVAVAGTPGETVDSNGVRLYRPVGSAVSSSPSLQLFPTSPNNDNANGKGDQFAPVVTIDQWPRWQVTAQVPESQISSVHPGEHADFSLAALGGRKLRCVVTQIMPNPLSVGGSVAYDVRLRLEQAAPPGVLPGMTGSLVLRPRH